MDKRKKTIIALLCAFILTLFLGQTVFNNNSPLINKYFFSKLFTVNTLTPTPTPLEPNLSPTGTFIQPTNNPFVEPQTKPTLPTKNKLSAPSPIPTTKKTVPPSKPTTTPVIIQPTSLPPQPEPTSSPLIPYPETSNRSYGSIEIISSPSDRPAEQHADLNLSLRGYTSTSGPTALSDLQGDTDAKAPQFTSLLSNNPNPPIVNLYRINGWDWASNSKTGPITDPSASMFGIRTTPGEELHVLNSGYDIGQGFQVMILYASQRSITMKYTREDNVVSGYTLNAEGIWVDPNLVALYEQLNAAGRHSLPALRGGETFGIASNNEVKMVMRDTGTFMDIRSRKDWWH